MVSLGDVAFPEPGDTADPTTLLVRLLDSHRATAVRKVASLDDVVALQRATGDRTRRVLGDHALAENGAVGGRFTADPPTLASIGFHVLQEYARHVGHLDIATELAGGTTGE